MDELTRDVIAAAERQVLSAERARLRPLLRRCLGALPSNPVDQDLPAILRAELERD